MKEASRSPISPVTFDSTYGEVMQHWGLIRLPWLGQRGRAAAGCARAAAALRCAARTMLSSTLLAIYLTRILAVVICGSGSTCVSVLSS
jgi:hypothetical protein